jgi:hypothetical protein
MHQVGRSGLGLTRAVESEAGGNMARHEGKALRQWQRADIGACFAAFPFAAFPFAAFAAHFAGRRRLGGLAAFAACSFAAFTGASGKSRSGERGGETQARPCLQLDFHNVSPVYRCNAALYREGRLLQIIIRSSQKQVPSP